MKGLVIRNGRVIDPANDFDDVADLFIVDGRIAAVGQAPASFQAEQSLDAAGLVVCPGLVDLSARLREPGATHKATIASEAQAAVAGGITTLCLPPDTQPVIDTPSVVQLVLRRAEEAGAARVVPLGALTQQLAGQLLSGMAALRDAGCPALSDGGRPVVNSRVLRRALEYAATFELPVLLTPKDVYLSEGGLIHEGAVATRLGLPGIPEAAETAALARDLALVEQTGARVHFARLSAARAADWLARARRDGLPVSADVAAHQLFLTEMDLWDFNATCRVEPPLREQRDRDALRRAVAEGVIEVICSDHQPHEPDAKDAPLAGTEPGVSGLDTLLALVLRLVQEDVLALPRALATVTCNPARLLGLDAGHLTPGAPADLCLFDPDRPWRLTAEAMRSRGRNSPFLGWEFTGQVVHTLVGGRCVYSCQE